MAPQNPPPVHTKPQAQSLLPQRDIDVSVTCTQAHLEIKVSPWSQGLKDGQVVQWHAKTDNIVLLSITPTDPANWPFNENPVYDAADAKNPKAKRSKPLKNDMVIPYTIEIRFKDSLDQERQAIIDPDMVMET